MCALVTGVQTCALPIFLRRAVREIRRHFLTPCDPMAQGYSVWVYLALPGDRGAPMGLPSVSSTKRPLAIAESLDRSEERRVGEECVSTFSYRWSPSN